MRRLVLVLGDQLDRESAAFDDFDPAQDAVWMAEVREEAAHVWSHKARIALFLAAMRHFAADLRTRGWQVHYQQLDAPAAATSLAAALSRDLERLQPATLCWVQPGDWRVQQAVQAVARAAALPLDTRDDRHFFTTPAEFAAWADGRREQRMEFWYRLQRRRFGVLMAGDTPIGGRWNFDAENRAAFGRRGPPPVPVPVRFAPDALTAGVLALVTDQFAEHPGSLADFDWPVTPAQARTALADFIDWRLPRFGQHQDAMWRGEPWLFHARLSAALNLKLIAARTVVGAALDAHTRGAAPLAAVEGFVRQILGWREYVRGFYWWRMPQWLDDNALAAHAPLPAFYWDGETDLACLREVIGQTLRTGYAHHIQRLMVTGLFALLLGVAPRAIHAWYLAIYVDAVEWVELPNTLGMSQFADGGGLASKPYCASGKYIQRMSNYCADCRYNPSRAIGEDACPFTTLYWDFLDRHRARFAHHPRTAQMWRNLERLSAQARASIALQARALRVRFAPTDQ